MGDASFDKHAKMLSRPLALLLCIFSIQALFATNQQRPSSRISSVSRALDWSAGGRGFNSRDWAKTQNLNEDKSTAFAQQVARLSQGSDNQVKWRSRLQQEI